MTPRPSRGSSRSGTGDDRLHERTAATWPLVPSRPALPAAVGAPASGRMSSDTVCSPARRRILDGVAQPDAVPLAPVHAFERKLDGRVSGQMARFLEQRHGVVIAVGHGCDHEAEFIDQAGLQEGYRAAFRDDRYYLLYPVL